MSPRSAIAWSSTGAVEGEGERHLAALALVLDRRVELAEEADPALLAEAHDVADREPLGRLDEGAPARAVEPLVQRRLDLRLGRRGRCAARAARAGITLVSLTTSASPGRSRSGRSRDDAVLDARRLPGRTTSSRAASRGLAGRSAMRSGGRSKSNRSVRMEDRRFRAVRRTRDDILLRIRRQACEWIAGRNPEPADLDNVARQQDKSVSGCGCHDDEIGQADRLPVGLLAEPSDMTGGLGIDRQHTIAEVVEDRGHQSGKFIGPFRLPLSTQLQAPASISATVMTDRKRLAPLRSIHSISAGACSCRRGSSIDTTLVSSRYMITRSRNPAGAPSTRVR